MTELPSMWRVELFHPLSVHLPLGILFGAAALRGLSVFLWLPLFKSREAWSRNVDVAARIMTVMGALSAWVAYVTGNLAEEEVNGLLCDPTLTHKHGDLAFYVTAVFSVIALCDVAAFVLNRDGSFRKAVTNKAMTVALTIAALLGATGLAYVGHLGASLVYQQGAAVYKPSEECTEFAE